MNYEEFEDSEQEIFLDIYYDYKNAKLILTSLQEENYPFVRERTKKGIKKGIEDFLRENSSPNLYSSDLSEFCFDNSVEQRVAEEVQALHLNLYNIQLYAQDVCQTYRMFVYNESRDRFLNLSEAK